MSAPAPDSSAFLRALLPLAQLFPFVFGCISFYTVLSRGFRCSPPPNSPPQRVGRPTLQPFPGAEAGSLVLLEGGAMVFETAADPDEVRRFYATPLTAEGWRLGGDGLPSDDSACPALALRLTVYGQEGGRTRYYVGMAETPCTVPPC